MLPWWKRRSLLLDINYNGVILRRSFSSEIASFFFSSSSKMNRVILQLFAVGFCFAVGQALQCYKCTFGLGSICIKDKTTCNRGELCYIGVGRAVGAITIKTQGCLAVANCNQTKEVNFPSSSNSSTIYTMTKTCCDSDLCNAAPGLPRTSGLSLAVATITALFVAKVLV